MFIFLRQRVLFSVLKTFCGKIVQIWTFSSIIEHSGLSFEFPKKWGKNYDLIAMKNYQLQNLLLHGQNNSLHMQIFQHLGAVTLRLHNPKVASLHYSKIPFSYSSTLLFNFLCLESFFPTFRQNYIVQLSHQVFSSQSFTLVGLFKGQTRFFHSVRILTGRKCQKHKIINNTDIGFQTHNSPKRPSSILTPTVQSTSL